jgi:murein L,D-transpeptidase YafK
MKAWGQPVGSGSFGLNRRPLLRSLLASAAIAAAIALGGCDTDGVAPSGRALQPLSERMLGEIERKNMSKESPILVRLFKEEAELEVWKEDKSGHFALLKAYPICRWSGELGPKIKEGDRQAPEGFYTITPSLMNPNSSYYLAINMGFPNAYDRANGRSGNFLMIHGDCSSRGCYAMTDEQIAEIYALARESFFGGQRAFQIQAYPFRMTPLNMAKHRNSPHMAFWKMLKEGYDHFEVSRLEPKVDVCEKRYVFDADASAKFSPAAKCPVYQIPEDLVSAVQEKQQRDDKQVAELVSRGTDTVPVRTGTDGGMNPVFLAAVKSYGGPGAMIRSASIPGTIPAHVNPPGEPTPEATGSTMSLASAESKPAPGPRSQTPAASAANKQASASPNGSGGNLFGNLFSSGGDTAKAKAEPESPGVLDRVSRLMGLRSSEPTPPPAPDAGKPKPLVAAKPAQTVVAAKPKSPSDSPLADVKAANAAPQSNGVLNGAQPPLQAGSFESRFGGFQ